MDALCAFSFAEQVDFLVFPLFWFQPPSGMFLPGHIPHTRLIAFHSVSVFLARTCALDGCDTVRINGGNIVAASSFRGQTHI